MYRLEIGIEREGYLQEVSIPLMSLRTREMFEAWLDSYGIEHTYRKEGYLEVRVYAIRLENELLSRFLIHDDKDYTTDDYDLWLVNPRLFDVCSFIVSATGTDFYTPLINEMLDVWDTGIELGVFSFTMNRDELKKTYEDRYIGHFASRQAALIQLEKECIIFVEDVDIDNNLEFVMAGILHQNEIVEKHGHYFFALSGAEVESGED